MPAITGIDRHQINFSNLVRRIAKDNEIQFIDAFVEKLDLKQAGFKSQMQLLIKQ